MSWCDPFVRLANVRIAGEKKRHGLQKYVCGRQRSKQNCPPQYSGTSRRFPNRIRFPSTCAPLGQTKNMHFHVYDTRMVLLHRACQKVTCNSSLVVSPTKIRWGGRVEGKGLMFSSHDPSGRYDGRFLSPVCACTVESQQWTVFHRTGIRYMLWLTNIRWNH